MYASKLRTLSALILSALTAIASITAVHAQSASSPGSSPQQPQNITPRQSAAADEIRAINERMAVMSARLQELELQAKIAAKSNEIRRFRGSDVLHDDGHTPSVIDINGVDGKLWATLHMQGGNEKTVRVGDRVGTWVVRAITIDTVTVQRGRETVRLAFGTHSPQRNQPGLPGLPGLSGLPSGGLPPPLPR